MQEQINTTSNTPIITGKPEGWEDRKSTSNQDVTKLMQSLGVNMYLEEKVDLKEDEDRIQLVVESKRVRYFKRHYSLRKLASIAEDLMANGHKVNAIELRKLIDLITDNAAANTISKYHTGIGWFSYDNAPAFSYNRVATSEGELPSEYRGQLKLEQQGNIKNYMDGIRELVVPQPKLFTVYVAGVSGIIIQALRETDTNILINICGESSIGKTTAENVALSFWGKAQAQGFNTLNRTEEILAQRFIMPMTVDDMLSVCSGSGERAKQRSIIEHIFRFSAGKLKGRMGQADADYFGAVLASTEFSMLEKTLDSDTNGQFYRLVELQVKKGELTKDTSHARKLNELISQNYGLAAYELGKFMIEHKYTGNRLKELYKEQHSSLLDDKRLANHSRAANRLAILMVTAVLLNECFDLQADIEGIREVLIRSVYSSTHPLDKRKAAYMELQGLVKENKGYFAVNQGAFKPQQHIGVFNKNTYGYPELIIPTPNLEPLLNNVPLPQVLAHTGNMRVRQPSAYETKNILNYWKSQGWLRCGGRSDQLYMKRKLGDNTKQVLVYVITFERDEDTDDI